VRVARVAEIVASTLRQEILAGELDDGDGLPPLDRLVERFEVSPASIREAMRILETEGLVSVRRGSLGGAAVHRPQASSAAYMLSLVLESQRTRVADLTAALLEMELAVASACAVSDDRAMKVVPALHDALAIAAQPGGESFGVGLVAFHGALTRDCGNATLVLVVGALGDLWASQDLPWPHRVFYTELNDKSRGRIIDAYRGVADAIEAGDPTEASGRLRAILSDPETRRSARGRNPVLRAVPPRKPSTTALR
jgi:DNA-binding FadR family transcriptional regulator